MNKFNAKMPSGADELGRGVVFYINNTLVPETDGSRIIGPLTAEQLESKVIQYNAIVSSLPESERKEYLLIIYELRKVDYKEIFGLDVSELIDLVSKK